jgi:hypothetical protein
VSSFAAVVVGGMAKALWCDAWANWADEQHKINPHNRHYPMGCELMDYCPPWPERAYHEAWRLLGRIEECNGVGICVLCSWAFQADHPGAEESHADWTNMGDDHWELFGHYLAMGALGHGASWFDDHERFDLRFPRYTYVDFDEELEELLTKDEDR